MPNKELQRPSHTPTSEVYCHARIRLWGKDRMALHLNTIKIGVMNEEEQANAVVLIRRIQLDGGSDEDLKALEQTTGNPNIRIIFDALELEGFLPVKLLSLLGGNAAR